MRQIDLLSFVALMVGSGCFDFAAEYLGCFYLLIVFDFQEDPVDFQIGFDVMEDWSLSILLEKFLDEDVCFLHFALAHVNA